MKKRFKLNCAVCLILTKKENNKEYVLLQRRFNTGILDNMYDLSATGHLEKNETLTAGIIRETKEEIGITITKDDLNFVCTIHANFKNCEYLLITFSTNKFKGEPKIMEPNKCSELKWFDLNKLPTDLIDNRKLIIDAYLNSEYYNEYGFN